MNDQTPDTSPIDDETKETQEQLTADSGESPKRLLRSRSDRMIFGVAGGLGRYFDVDPVIVRIAFGVSLFFGGLGALAYLALAIFVPSEEGGPAPVERNKSLMIAAIAIAVLVVAPITGAGLFWTGGSFGALWLLLPIGAGLGVYAVLRERGTPVTAGRVFGAIVIVFAAILGLIVIASIGAFLAAIGEGVVIASLILAAGVAIVIGAFFGGVRWLIAPALALALGVGVASAADLDFEGGVGQRHYTPTSLSAIPADGYRLGVGELKIDTRDLDWSKRQVVHLDASLGVGELEVLTPENVCVEVDAHAGAGHMAVTGHQSDGVDVDLDQATGASATPRLVLDADIDVGELKVTNSDTADISDYHRGVFGAQGEAMREAERTACEL